MAIPPQIPSFIENPTFGTSSTITAPGLTGTGLLSSSSSAIPVSGSGSIAGAVPPPRDLSLDPRYVLTTSILGSLSSLYQVSFSGFPLNFGNTRFVEDELGLLCHSATLPATSVGTLEVSGQFQGINERFAHTRIYPSVTFSFYETTDYKTIEFFDAWQRYITVDGDPQASDSYYYRMRYPSEYKCDSMYITKFEKNYGNSVFTNTLSYQFIKCFPSNVTSIPVQYGDSEILKVSVEFSYDRYIQYLNGKIAENKPRPTQSGKTTNPTAPVSTPQAAPAPIAPRDDLAIWAKSNRKMIDSVGTKTQKSILADADKRFPVGSPANAALRTRATQGTYSVPGPTGKPGSGPGPLQQAGRPINDLELF